MNATDKPTIVLVHGAWHTPAAFDPILPLLHAARYPTTAVVLPSTGCSPGIADFTPDVEAIRDVVEGLAELGRQIVIVSHSYGAIPASEALVDLSKENREKNGLPGGVVKLIFVAAVLPVKGKNAKDTSALRRTPTVVTKMVINHDDNTSSVANGEECFYHDVAPEIARYFTRLLRRQSLGALTSPLTYEAYRDIPSAYLICADDRSLAVETQEAIIENTGIKVTTTLQTSHSPFLSQPEAVVKFIRWFVEEWA